MRSIVIDTTLGLVNVASSFLFVYGDVKSDPAVEIGASCGMLLASTLLFFRLCCKRKTGDAAPNGADIESGLAQTQVGEGVQFACNKQHFLYSSVGGSNSNLAQPIDRDEPGSSFA